MNVFGGAPYGYRYISRHEGDGQARYEIIEEEASVVQQVFGWVGRDGISIGEVRRRLHDQGVKTKTGKDWWDRTTIWAMLKNPAYKGFAAFGKTRVGIRASKERLSKLQTEEKTLSAEQSEQAQLRVVIDRLEEFRKQIAEGLDGLDWHARREVIRLLVKRVEIDRNEVRVIYKVSPPPFVSSPASGACLQDCWR